MKKFVITEIFGSGIGFVILFEIVYILLKLCGVVSWGWGRVLSPLWMSAIVLAVIVAPVIAVDVIASREIKCIRK